MVIGATRTVAEVGATCVLRLGHSSCLRSAHSPGWTHPATCLRLPTHSAVQRLSMARDLRLMADLTWEEFRDRARDVVALLPLGAVEQHGPHLPLDTDTVVPRGICLALADRAPAIVVPPIAYGYKSQPTTGGGGTFPGTTNLDGGTFTALVRDVVRELMRHGVRAIVLVNGNYENNYFAIEGIDLALRDAGSSPPSRVLMVNWWEPLTKAALEEGFDGEFAGWASAIPGVAA